MADFSFLSDTDESAVEQILAEAMDHCVLQQVAAINCSSFSHSVLPSNLESRFQRLKTFPSSSSSSHPLKPAPKFQLGPGSSTESKNPVNELKNEIPKFDDSNKTPEKGRKSGSGYLSSPSGSSTSSSGHLNSPNLRVKQGAKKGKGGNFSSGSDSSTKTVKTGCFWCTPKRVSRKKSGGARNGAVELGDEWGKHDELLSGLRSFSSKKQEKLMKIAKKEEEKINREAEKIVKWAKQTSARLDFSVNDDDLSDDDFVLH